MSLDSSAPDYFPFSLGFVTGFGVERQQSCYTDQKGPEIYSKCANGAKSQLCDETYGCETIDLSHKSPDGDSCVNSPEHPPPIFLDPVCEEFNKQYKNMVFIFILCTNSSESILV